MEDISQFLIESYGNSSTSVVIYEVAEPNYLIGVSTGSDSARMFLSSDLTKPCPVDRGDDIPCTPVRISVRDLEGDANHDKVLVASSQRHKEAGYPQDLLSVKVSNNIDSMVYVSQSTLYAQSGTELAWRVIIVSPGAKSDTDGITKGDQLLVAICVVGALGFCTCSIFFYIMHQKRRDRAVVFGDWRFTCGFILGCVLLNGSTFTLIGENTDTTCLLRMWSFHLFFVMALSPLFVKIWRIYKLAGSLNLRRNAITNSRAVMYTLPITLCQGVILLVFTFVDPPKQTEIIESDGGVVVQRIVCATNTDAFVITQAIFEAGFVFIGCVLAYLTRNTEDDLFGESKQLIFSMYNIAFVGIIVVVIVSVADLDGNGQSIMQAIGVFWGTVFSTGAFAIPCLLRHMRRESRVGQSSSIYVSGIHHSSPFLDRTLDRIAESELEDEDSSDFDLAIVEREQAPDTKPTSSTAGFHPPAISKRLDSAGLLQVSCGDVDDA